MAYDGCTFDLWADDVPTCPVELRDSEGWVKPTFGYADPAAHWRRRLHDGLAHNLGLVIANAVQGELAADVPPADAARQMVLFGTRHGYDWGVGLTIFTALGNLLPVLPEEATYLALFHGACRVAADRRVKRRAGRGPCLQAVRISRHSSENMLEISTSASKNGGRPSAHQGQF